ncbi:hypothetical protein O6H91_09G043700 [Diphasiastrum complanatum]|uniref:Uncharacterized protein n=1 Tax=Diphasiastrum complanatum TaxID=34168 RepID=A0ACC2CNS6_DIPCM|nr:hypothetical protein O6H91_09G043700 [Diphasiastrum complanatum]
MEVGESCDKIQESQQHQRILQVADEAFNGEDGQHKPLVPTDSALYVWGYNDCGQIAQGEVLGRRKPCLRVPMRVASHHFKARRSARMVRLLDIACGLQHTAAVASDGSLFTWGSNAYGQLGDGSEDDCGKPKRVKSLREEFVKSVACGAHCTAAITVPRRSKDVPSPNSRLWGSNHPRIFWGVFSCNTSIIQVACGMAHVAALSVEGVLQTWGYNEYGQLGRGLSCEGQQEARLVTAFVKFLDEPPELVRVSKVACGEYHTAAVADNGDLYTWGLGYMGQLGHRALQSPHKEVLPRRVVGLEGVKVEDVACGGVHTCAVTSNGALYMWGGGQAGQLGLGQNRDFVSLDANEVEFLLRRTPALVIPNGVRHVTCGQYHTLVAMVDGRLLGWGYNSYGQAATGRTAYAWHPSPIDWCVGEVRRLAAGGGHSAVLTQAFSLKELCELRLVDYVSLTSAPKIEDIAARNGSDSLARFCERFREHLSTVDDDNFDEDEDRRRRSRSKPKKPEYLLCHGSVRV